jgi:hypothetical protein
MGMLFMETWLGLSLFVFFSQAFLVLVPVSSYVRVEYSRRLNHAILGERIVTVGWAFPTLHSRLQTPGTSLI